jgi:hypothetical protein
MSMTANKRGDKVEGVIVIAIVVGIGYWMFREACQARGG